MSRDMFAFVIIHECMAMGTPFTVVCSLWDHGFCLHTIQCVLHLSMKLLGSESVYDCSRWYSDDIYCVRSVGEFMFYKVALRIVV